MYYLTFGFLLFFSLHTLSASDSVDTPILQKKMSLAECQEIAIKNSEDLSIADLETLMAEDTVREIRGGIMPKVAATGNYTTRNNHRGAVFWARPEHGGGGEGQGEEGHKKMHRPEKEKIKTVGGNKQIRTARLSLIVPVYDFEVTLNKMRSQRMIVDSTIHERERIKQDILFAVTQTYYKVLEGEKIESVVKQSIHTLENQRKIAQDFYSVGLVTKNDVLVVEVQLSERHQELIQARHHIATAISELNRFMRQNNGIRTSAEIENVIEDVSWHANLDQIVSEALESHHDLKRLTAQKEASVYDYKSEKGKLLPNVVMYTSANACSDSYLLHKHWLDFGIGIEFPIFDGGITKARIDRKSKQISEAELRYKSALEDIELEIKNAFLGVESAYMRIPVAKKSVTLAEENLKMSRDQFQEGMLTSSDVLDDEERLDIARSNYYQALYAFHTAKSHLDYAACIIGKSISKYESKK